MWSQSGLPYMEESVCYIDITDTLYLHASMLSITHTHIQISIWVGYTTNNWNEFDTP